MSYSYYQNAPGWGTSQYQFRPPPAPTFQPQPTWGGLDFYQAHAPSPDPSIYNNAWNRVRSYSDPGSAGLGVGLNEARHWHRRTYGGLSQINMLAPEEIGHAAAYEAYRTWIHNANLYQPLSADDERQREALVGIAVAEVNRILQYSERRYDRYVLQLASEAAAATASVIFSQSAVDYGDYSPDNMYAYDEPYYPRRSRHRRRHSSVSGSRPPIIQMAPAAPGSVYAGTPIAGSTYGGAMPTQMAGSTYGGASPYGGYGAQPVPIQATNTVGFPSQGMAYGGGMAGTQYGGGSYGLSSSPYGNGMYGVPQSAASTIVVQTPGRNRHRHRSHSRHGHRRARSNTIDTYGYGSGGGMGAQGIGGTSIGAPQVYRY
ncbi:hypothetical protein PUNSTDRAFT_131893 [Punctularia strigosozonata HHB-11173 SS5]|uniref:uncharacterized protein n=1 Tax=Punctularia strigosozonata (strain HHB-11173) TaxID=741275 RepID=UPI00044170CA|nr:uncharacterized protein PUNSTDRAFT_131893 [Punctularia strigosozonata HHB-11173 SS5]EIN11738.1 hypothetical protein PUNSTDRAFT_131893 [Punctularia strigosozonata HHB-11173 SS5]